MNYLIVTLFLLNNQNKTMRVHCLQHHLQIACDYVNFPAFCINSLFFQAPSSPPTKPHCTLASWLPKALARMAAWAEPPVNHRRLLRNICERPKPLLKVPKCSMIIGTQRRTRN